MEHWAGIAKMCFGCLFVIENGCKIRINGCILIKKKFQQYNHKNNSNETDVLLEREIVPLLSEVHAEIGILQDIICIK